MIDKIDNYRKPDENNQVSPNRNRSQVNCPLLAEILQDKRIRLKLSEGQLTFQVNLLRGAERTVSVNSIHRALRHGKVGLELLAQIIWVLRDNPNAGVYVTFDGASYKKIAWEDSGEGTPINKAQEREIVEVKPREIECD